MPEAIERAVDALPLASPDAASDAVIRIGLPYDLAPAGRICTLVMATVEAGLLSPNRIHGGVPLHRALQGSDVLLFTPSVWAYEGLMLSGAPPERVHVVPHGVHPAIYSPASPPERARLRERLGWRDDFIFMHVGAMTANKGIDRLLQAFAALLERRPAARLVLKGTDSLFRSEEMLKGHLADLPRNAAARVAARITYLGGNYSFADMACLYQAADAYVAPYLAEGFNLPALEAAACGLPLICTAGGPTDDFTTGAFNLRIESRLAADERRLLPETEHLAQLMERALVDKAWIDGARGAGPAHIVERFTWRHAADRLLGIFTAMGL